MALKLRTTESGGIGYKTINNKLENNLNGFRLKANWDGMDEIYEERRPFSLIVGVYWVFEPKNISNFTRRRFETDPENTRQAITYVPIFEEKIDLLTRGQYQKDIVIPSFIPVRDGLTYGNRIIVWFKDQTFFEESILDEQHRISIDYHFPKWRFMTTQQGTQDNLQVLELVQKRKVTKN